MAILLWLIGIAVAANIDLSLDTSEVAVGDGVGLLVTVVDASPTAIPRITPPSGVDIRYQQQVASSYWVNGKATRTVKYRFVVTPTRPGRMVIGPASVELGNRREQSGTVELNVVPRDKAKNPSLEAINSVTSDNVYLGQILIYHYMIRSREAILGSRWTLPTFDALSPAVQGQPARREYAIDGTDGPIYVDETDLPLVAKTIGPVALPAAIVQVDLPVKRNQRPSKVPDLLGMFDVRREVAVAEPLSIHVLPLPTPAPLNFNGLVGEAEVRSELSSTIVPVGKSVEWKISIEGEIFPSESILPAVSEVPGLRFYDSVPEVQVEIRDGRFFSKTTWVRTLVATAVGKVKIPDSEIIIFSPQQKKYIAHPLQISELSIVPGEGEKSELAKFGTYIELADNDLSLRLDKRYRGLDLPSSLWWMGGIAPILAFPALFLMGHAIIVPWVRRPQRREELPSKDLDHWQRLEHKLRQFKTREEALQELEPQRRELLQQLFRGIDRVRFAQEPDAQLESNIEKYLRGEL